MDPPSTVHPEKDTTYALGEEASRRGHEIHFSLIQDIYLLNDLPHARHRKFVFRNNLASPIEFLSDYAVSDLEKFDYILMRKDPPFDARFIFICQFLRLVSKGKVLNDPTGIVLAPEKIYPLRFPGIFPPTMITSNFDTLLKFSQDMEGVILKPLDGNGGRGVLLTSSKDKNIRSMFEILSLEGTTPIIAQKYLPEIRQGDIRIILLDGEPVGAINRLPSDTENRANMHIGGKAVQHVMTEGQLKLCAVISDSLKKDGLYLTGIDVIGDYITEINVTSPTGIQEIKRFGGRDIAAEFWSKLGL